MTREETVNFIRKMVSIFPSWKPDNLTETVNAWHSVLSEYSFEECDRALNSYLKSEARYTPSASQLIVQIEKSKNKSGIDWDEVAREIMEGQK